MVLNVVLDGSWKNSGPREHEVATTPSYWLAVLCSLQLPTGVLAVGRSRAKLSNLVPPRSISCSKTTLGASN